MLDEQSSEVERLVELGEVDTFLLLETVSRRFEAKSRLLDLRGDEIGAAIEIARLLGPDDPHSPAQVVSSGDSDTATNSTSNTAALGNTPIKEEPR